MTGGIFNYFKDNKDAFTSIGILLTFLISSFSLYFSARNNKAVHYVNSITKSRIEWIQKLRSTIAEFIANTNIYNNVYYNSDDEKAGLHLSKCQKLCSEIRLLLNYCDVKDKHIIDLANKILKNYTKYCDGTYGCAVGTNGCFVENQSMINSKNQVEKDIELLSKEIQIYLKSEWNRVKYESQGKIYEKDTQKFDYCELEKMYDDSSYIPNKWTRFRIDITAKLKRNLTSPTFVVKLLALALIMSVALIAARYNKIRDSI